MAEVTINRTYTLILSLKEAELIRELTRNPSHDMETGEEHMIRKEIFEALSGAVANTLCGM